MAHTYVYTGSVVTIKADDGRYCAIDHGKYFFTHDVGSTWAMTKFAFYDVSTSRWRTISVPGDYSLGSGRFRLQKTDGSYTSSWVVPLVEANVYMYGSVNSYAGGSMYTIRYDTGLYNSSLVKQVDLPAGYRVIIGAGQGYTRYGSYAYDNHRYIRAWGYKTSSGRIVETQGLFVYEYPLVYPNMYKLNTA